MSFQKYSDFGLLVLRTGIGISFVCHGYPKIMGGPEVWAKLGMATQAMGIDFVPTFWGFMAAVSESLGGLLLVLGLMTRPACFLLLSTMIVATAMHINQGDPFMKYSHALESAIVFLSLLLIGPGRFSMDSHRQGV